MMRFSERARIALEKTPQPMKSKLTKIIHDLEHGRPLRSLLFHRKMRYREDVWVVRTESKVLYYSKKDDEITILDILDPTEYRHD